LNLFLFLFFSALGLGLGLGLGIPILLIIVGLVFGYHRLRGHHSKPTGKKSGKEPEDVVMI